MRSHLRFAVLVAAASLAGPSHLLAAGLGGATRDLGGAVQRLNEGSSALAPFASVKFCLKNKDQCVDTGGPGIVQLDEDRLEQLKAVNSGINRAIRPVNDRSGEDVWSADVASGDCEDFALTKRKHLIALGWPSRALRIAVARTSSGEGHAVLVVKTSKGDLVLDNRSSAIKEWRKTGLRWIMMQSGDNPRLWVNIVPSKPRPVLVSQAVKRRVSHQLASQFTAIYQQTAD